LTGGTPPGGLHIRKMEGEKEADNLHLGPPSAGVGVAGWEKNGTVLSRGIGREKESSGATASSIRSGGEEMRKRERERAILPSTG